MDMTLGQATFHRAFIDKILVYFDYVVQFHCF